MRRDEEAELVRRVAAGDRDAFQRLVEAHQVALGAYAQRMLGDRAGAEDVVQETFLRLWARAARFRPDSARLTTWLHSIAHNLCVDDFRRGARVDYGDAPECTAGRGDEPVDAEERRERDAGVRRAIAGLPERQRSALVLCHYQGLSNLAAAQILGVSVEALESLLARARRTLKKELGGLGDA